LKPNQYRDDKGVIRTVQKPPPKPPLSTEMHPLADVVEWVITHDAKDDFTHEQVFYRGIKDDRPAEFHKMRESFKKPAAASATVPENVDEASESVERRIEEVLGLAKKRED
jgi:hypothetical protein